LIGEGLEAEVIQGIGELDVPVSFVFQGEVGSEEFILQFSLLSVFLGSADLRSNILIVEACGCEGRCVEGCLDLTVPLCPELTGEGIGKGLFLGDTR
jgi:hypothetical protein